MFWPSVCDFFAFMDQSKKCYPSNDCQSPGVLGREEPEWAKGKRGSVQQKVQNNPSLDSFCFTWLSGPFAVLLGPIQYLLKSGSSCLGSSRNWWSPLVRAAAVGNCYGFGERRGLTLWFSWDRMYLLCPQHENNLVLTFHFLLLRKKGVMFLYSSLMGLRPPPTVIPLVSQLVIL